MNMNMTLISHIGIFLLGVFVSINSKSINDVRLVYGPNKFEGRVEVYYSDGPDDRYGDWGTFCDKSGDFTKEEATVICRQMGYSTENVKVYESNHYKSPRGSTSFIDVLINNVHCTGDEKSIEDCTYEAPLPWNRRYCYHKNDIGIACGHQFENLAFKKPTTQSDNGTYPSSWGNDAGKNPNCCLKDFTCFYAGYKNPWWAVDLGRPARIHQVSILGNNVYIHNGNDADNVHVGIMDEMPQIGDDLTTESFKETFTFPGKPPREADLILDPEPVGRVVVVQTIDKGVFSLCDVEVFGEYVTED